MPMTHVYAIMHNFTKPHTQLLHCWRSMWFRIPLSSCCMATHFFPFDLIFRAYHFHFDIICVCVMEKCVHSGVYFMGTLSWGELHKQSNARFSIFHYWLFFLFFLVFSFVRFTFSPSFRLILPREKRHYSTESNSHAARFLNSNAIRMRLMYSISTGLRSLNLFHLEVSLPLVQQLQLLFIRHYKVWMDA